MLAYMPAYSLTPITRTYARTAAPASPAAAPNYLFRPAVPADSDAIFETLRAAAVADSRGQFPPAHVVRSQFDDSWTNPAQDTLLALSGGGVAGLAWLFASPEPEGEARAELLIEVHPQHRDHGLEELLLGTLENWSRQRLLSAPAGMPRAMRFFCQEKAAFWCGFFETHGYQVARRSYRMRRDLSEPIPEPKLPPGLEMRVYTPEMARAAMDAHNDAFRDHWSFDPATWEDWSNFVERNEDFRPDLSLLVMAGDEIAGISINRVRRSENEFYGIREGWIGILGVRRPWRKQGVATALLCQSMLAFKAAGMDYAGLGVDTENTSGAVAVYERVGFKSIQRNAIYEKRMD